MVIRILSPPKIQINSRHPRNPRAKEPILITERIPPFEIHFKIRVRYITHFVPSGYQISVDEWQHKAQKHR